MKELEEFYKKNKDRHVNMMARILNWDFAGAEDVVSEAYCRAVQYWPSYDPKRGAISPWFNRLLFNSLRDAQNEFRNRPTEDSVLLSNEDVLPYKEQKESALDLIEQVENENHQRVLYLYYILGYNSREISQIEEKTSQTNVTTIINRFKEDIIDRENG